MCDWKLKTLLSNHRCKRCAKLLKSGKTVYYRGTEKDGSYIHEYLCIGCIGKGESIRGKKERFYLGRWG